MDYSLESDIKTLLSISKQTPITAQDAQKVADILRRYLTLHERNQSFQSAVGMLSEKFGEFLIHFDFNNGTKFANNFYLFCYTLIPKGKDFIGVQNEIYKNVAVPFQRWVKNKVHNFENIVSNIPRGDDYVFICRRALVTGMYAPGKSVYTYAEALLSRGESVWIIALYNSDPQFINLKKQYKKLKLTVLVDTRLEVKLISVIEILKIIQPKVILTETEFDLPSILGICKFRIPTIYLSQTFYNLPWYDSIGVVTNIDDMHEGRDRKDFFDIPVWVNRDILAPNIDFKLIEQAKAKLGINKFDFVLGAFARMEKFSEPFLDLVYSLLIKEKNIKVLLAGPNDQKKVLMKLKKFIDDGRVMILGQVDVNIFGHCIDIGIDTFPLHSAYSVLELMAKNIPVVSKKDEFLGSLIKDRLPQTLKYEENELKTLVCKLVNNPKFLIDIKKKTDDFMINHDKSKIFLKALDERIAILKNSI
tara:strand:- start:596 stop:2020 length:1425 start_codon:yes stop_codon:yes gene_type:complete